MTTTNPLKALAAKIPLLHSTISDLKEAVPRLPEDAESTVKLFDDANRMLRVCLKLTAGSKQAQQKYGSDLQAYQKYLASVQTDVEGQSRAALLGGSETSARGVEKGRNLQGETEDSLARSVALSGEALDTGYQTMNTLGQQREQLEHTQGMLREVDQQMDQADYLLRGIKSLGGAFTNLFRSTPVVNKAPPLSARSHRSSQQQHHQYQQQQAPATDRPSTRHQQQQGGGGGWGAAVGNNNNRNDLFSDSQPSVDTTNPFGESDQQQQQLVHDQRMNQGLSQISDNLSRMKVLAESMGNELDSQTRLMDDIENDVDRVGGRLESNNRKIKRILK